MIDFSSLGRVVVEGGREGEREGEGGREREREREGGREGERERERYVFDSPRFLLPV